MKLDDLLTTQEAAERAGVHTTTIKRWARMQVATGENVHVQVDKKQMGRFRYLIDSDFFDEHFMSKRKRLRTDSVEGIRRELAERVKLLEQQRTLIKQQQDLIDILTTRLGFKSSTTPDDR